MDIKSNDNFKNVSLYTMKTIDKNVLKGCSKTLHMGSRGEREKLAIQLDEGSTVDRTFLVDKGHKDGMEIHIVTTNGIIYILNNVKFFMGMPSFITVLIARPNQVKRLYTECGIIPNSSIIEKCREHQERGYNKR